MFAASYPTSGDNLLMSLWNRNDCRQDMPEYSNRLIDRLHTTLHRIEQLHLPGTHADSTQKAFLLRKAADAYAQMGADAHAAELYSSSLELANALCNDTLIAGLCNDLFAVHYRNKQFDSGADLLSIAEQVYSRQRNSSKLARIWNNFGLLYLASNQPDKALSYFSRALDAAKGNRTMETTIAVNRAHALVITCRERDAEAELADVVAQLANPTQAETETAIQATLNLALLRAHHGHFNSAHALMSDAPRLLGDQTRNRLPDSYAQMADICLITGDSIGALRQILKYEEIRDSIQLTQDAERLQQLLIMYESERLRNRNEQLRFDVERREVLITFSIVVLLLLALYAFLLFRRIRRERRLSAENLAQRQRLMALEKEAHELKNREMRRELDRKNRELTSFAIDQSAINEFHGNLAEKLRSGLAAIRENNCAAARSAITEVLSELRLSVNNRTSEDFRKHFEEVHPDFFRNLTARCPTLSQTDQRLCAFLYLGMSTKEIAALTNRAIRSIESSRLRLRKKTGLEPAASIQAFLHSLTD